MKKEPEKHEVGQLREPKGFIPGNAKLFGEGFLGHMEDMKKRSYGSPFASYDQIAKSMDRKKVK